MCKKKKILMFCCGIWIFFSTFYDQFFLTVILVDIAETYRSNCSTGWSLVQNNLYDYWSIFICCFLFSIKACVSWFSCLCSMFPKSTHETFANKLFQNLRAHPRLGKAKFSETDFTISHYAGKASHRASMSRKSIQLLRTWYSS